MVEEISICYEIEASQEIYDSNEKKLTGKFEDKIGIISRNYSIVVNDKSKLGKVITSAYDVKSVEEIKNFFDDSTLVSYNEKMANLIEDYGIDSFPESMKINFQARRVIRRIDDFWGHENLYKWINNLKKQTIFQNNSGEKK